MTATASPMLGAHIPVSCPRCGGPLVPVNIGQPTDLCTHTTAIVHCPECPTRYQLTVTLRAMVGRFSH